MLSYIEQYEVCFLKTAGVGDFSHLRLKSTNLSFDNFSIIVTVIKFDKFSQFLFPVLTAVWHWMKIITHVNSRNA